MALQPRNKDENLKNRNQSSQSRQNNESEIGLILHKQQIQLNKIENALNERNENEKKKNDVLRKRIEELEKSESDRHKENERLLKNLEASTSNFNNLLDQLDNSTKNVKNNFISVARSYLKRIDTDNLQQDFSKAVKDELSDAKKEIRNSTNQAREENKEYKKIINERLANNDELINKYNKSINAMTKGITSLFFVIVMIALVSFVTGPIGEFFGVAHLYQFIQKFIDTHETPWRYLIGILYLLPYVCFAGIMWLVAKTLDVIR